LLFLLRITLAIKVFCASLCTLGQNFLPQGTMSLEFWQGLYLTNISFSIIAIFTILIFLSNEHGMSCLLLMSLLIFFCSNLWLSFYKSFIFFFQIIPKHLKFLKLSWLMLVSWLLSQTVHYLCVKMLLIFLYLFCILLLWS
jgi:hypothetical protein